MNAPLHPNDAPPPLEIFPYRLTDNVRFADLDPNNHVNNAVYSSYFETNRVLLVRDRENGLMPTGFAYVLVRMDIHFRAELHWPAPLELGLGVRRLGRTSVSFEQCVYSEGQCMATCNATTVLVDLHSRKPTLLTPEIIGNFQRFMMRDIDPA